jgi:hypothetical protein
MGGFMLYHGHTPIRTVLPGELEIHLEHHRIFITEKEIKDRSKGDALLKGFVILQTSWFVLQCIARGIQHLAVTELELVTLAFAALNLAIYTLWWKKPLNVTCPYPVYIDHVAPTVELKPQIEYDTHAEPGKLLDSSGQETKETGAGGKGGMLDWLGRKLVELTRLVVTRIRSFPSFLVDVIRRFFGAIVGIENNGYIVEEKRISTFYTGLQYPRGKDLSLAVVTTVVTMISGAVYCTAWHFQVPTHAEQLLWRLAAAIITGTPALIFLKYILPPTSRLPFLLSVIFGYSLLFISILEISFYVIARLTLLILPLISLRQLPAGAYQTVRWTTFIPHI